MLLLQCKKVPPESKLIDEWPWEPFNDMPATMEPNTYKLVDGFHLNQTDGSKSNKLLTAMGMLVQTCLYEEHFIGRTSTYQSRGTEWRPYTLHLIIANLNLATPGWVIIWKPGKLRDDTGVASWACDLYNYDNKCIFCWWKAALGATMAQIKGKIKGKR